MDMMIQQKDEDNTKEDIKESIGGNSSARSAAECIPDELLFEILILLPAQDIFHGARLVCKKWYNTTRTRHFIQKHLDHASYGLLWSHTSGHFVFTSAREDGGVTDTYKLNYTTKDKETLWSCCNGLMLECERTFPELVHYVRHVSTDQVFRLPPFFYHAFCCSMPSGIGYDAVSMTYKVVVPDNNMIYGYVCAILTLGVDKTWRSVRVDHLSDLAKQALQRPVPIFTEGFLHWQSFFGTEVVSLNLETEIITQTHIPIVKEIKRCFLSTGSCLSLLIQREKLVWEVFEMEPKNGELRKMRNICLEGLKEKINERLGFDFNFDFDVQPRGWLKYPEVLALRIQLVMVFYNLITFEVSAEKVPISGIYNVLHKNSLVWLGGA